MWEGAREPEDTTKGRRASKSLETELGKRCVEICYTDWEELSHEKEAVHFEDKELEIV